MEQKVHGLFRRRPPRSGGEEQGYAARPPVSLVQPAQERPLVRSLGDSVAALLVLGAIYLRFDIWSTYAVLTASMGRVAGWIGALTFTYIELKTPDMARRFGWLSIPVALALSVQVFDIFLDHWAIASSLNTPALARVLQSQPALARRITAEAFTSAFAFFLAATISAVVPYVLRDALVRVSDDLRSGQGIMYQAAYIIILAVVVLAAAAVARSVGIW